MNSELEISKNTPTVLVYEEKELRSDNLNEKKNIKPELTWEARLAMITMVTTFGLIAFIPIMGITPILLSAFISVLSYSNWESSKK